MPFPDNLDPRRFSDDAPGRNRRDVNRRGTVTAAGRKRHPIPIRRYPWVHDRAIRRSQQFMLAHAGSWRELRDFRSVVLAGKNHLTAAGFLGPMPAEYIDAVVNFINAADR